MEALIKSQWRHANSFLVHVAVPSATFSVSQKLLILAVLIPALARMYFFKEK